MEDQKNHSFISNFKIRRFFYDVSIFLLPILILYTILEINLRKIPFEPKVKYEYLLKNHNKIEILALGASQSERSINPEFLDINALNLGNSSQGLFEDFQLLKAFEPKLPNLELVILGLPFNSVHIGQDFTRTEVHQFNLIFYDVNTFGRNIKPQDYLLFHTNPDLFSKRLINFLRGDSPIKLNRHGFDINKFFGSYQAAEFKIDQIDLKDIYIDNLANKKVLLKSKKILKEFLSYCQDKDIEVLLYSPPSHFLYNELRDKIMVQERDSLVWNLKDKFPFVKFFNEEENEEFTTKYFYNANHLNPEGAKKATLRLNEFINENYNFKIKK